jgi:type III restriction enzyme
MIKLPIELREHQNWEEAVNEAIVKRTWLEKIAKDNGEKIRPIILFQAQTVNDDVNVAALKEYLVDKANIPELEIVVVTSSQKELDGVDILADNCRVKYVITVEALKEGWDCPFAYVLCSLANIKSSTSVEQLLGRVMRMPYAKKRKTSSLNKAYAYVLSKHFGESAKELVEKLKAKGFDENEAGTAIEHKPSELPGMFGRTEVNKVDLGKPLAVTDVPATIELENGGRTIVLKAETTDADIEVLESLVSNKEFCEIKLKHSNIKRLEAEPFPAKLGAKFTVPKMKVEMQGEWLFLEHPDQIFEYCDWDITMVDTRLEVGEFAIEPQGNSFVISLDGNKLRYGLMGNDQSQPPMIDVENWRTSDLIDWLDKTLQQRLPISINVTQSKMLEWLRQVVEYLTDGRGMALSQLMLTRYALANKLETKINKAYSEARTKAFYTALFECENRVMLDFDNGFEFSESMYDVGVAWHESSYKFQKHYLGAHKVPVIGEDSKREGEEFDCAIAIDAMLQVKYWLRNVARNRNSFWLQTSTDKFYPDFIALLDDERILVVEYKGELTSGLKDTKEKKMIGELWERHTKGRGLFLIAVKNYEGLDVREQILQKIGTTT